MAAPDFVATNLYAESVAAPRCARRMVSRDFFTEAVAFAEATTDFLTCALGLCAAYFSCAFLSGVTLLAQPARSVATISIALGMLVVFLLYREGAYRAGGGLLQIRETERNLRAPVQALILLWVFSLLLGLRLPVALFCAAVLTVPALLIAQKQVFFSVLARLRKKENALQRVVVFGAGPTGRAVLSALLDSPRLGLDPVAVVDSNARAVGSFIAAMGYRGRHKVPVYSGPLTPALLQSLRCHLLLFATPNPSPDAIAVATRAANQAETGIANCHCPAVTSQFDADSIELDGLFLTNSGNRSSLRLYAMAKRIADVILSVLLLVLLAPLLVLIAILVRLDTPGPSLFIQKRVGRDGELFSIFKFRSMVASAPEYAPSPSSSRDPRITRIGRMLRRTSLDELPQLINVLLGTMSLVGPRPEMPFIVERYNARQRQRLQVLPGITGLWQLSADRAFPIHHNIEYDLYYIRNRSLFLDAAILIHTLVYAMCGGI